MFEDVQSIAREAGALAVDHFKRIASIAVQSKGHLDLVTEADRQVELLIGNRLQALFPLDGIFGEEGAEVESRSGRTWVIDPIDGTFNFLRGNRDWAVSIGLYEQRRPRFGVLYAPMRGEFLVGGAGLPATINDKPLPRRSGLDPSRAACSIGFHPTTPVERQLAALRFIIQDASMSFRCGGSATTALIDVAKGEVDGYYGMGISTWDLMAILPIIETIGLTTTLDWPTIELPEKLRFVCGTAEFLSAFAREVPPGSR
jgi:myo-inositol-1(or 4)-monophosphatase